VAYNNHDIQDGIKAKLFSLNELIEINFFKEIYNSYKKNIKRDNKEIIIYQIIRDSINLMVKDIIKNSIKNIKENNIKKISDIQKNKKQTVIFSKKFLYIEKEIKQFLKTKMYNNKSVLIKNNNGKKVIKKLFKMITNQPRKFIKVSDLKTDQYRSISDYISGMTDRFAIQLYKSLI
jgi:dGTPase